MGKLRLPPLMRFPVPEHPHARLPRAEARRLAELERKGMTPADLAAEQKLLFRAERNPKPKAKSSAALRLTPRGIERVEP